MTLLEERVGEDGRVFLHASVTMPSLEVAAIGGGSNLEPQKSIVRDMTMGSSDKPGDKGSLSRKKFFKNKEIKARKINFQTIFGREIAFHGTDITAAGQTYGQTLFSISAFGGL